LEATQQNFLEFQKWTLVDWPPSHILKSQLLVSSRSAMDCETFSLLPTEVSGNPRIVKGLVIRDFAHEVGNILTELATEFLEGGLGIFYRVVENGRDQSRSIRHVSLDGKDCSNRYWMVDVGRGVGIFAALPSMLVGCERDSPKKVSRGDTRL
jgi:hypothetical protein